MKRNLYIIKDRVAEEICSPVFTAQNDDVAIRSFKGIIDGNPSYPNAVDYELLSIGDLDLVSGKVDGLLEPVKVCDGASLIKEDK